MRTQQKSREEVTGSLTIARTAAFVAFGLNLLFNHLGRPTEQLLRAGGPGRSEACDGGAYVYRGVQSPRTRDL